MTTLAKNLHTGTFSASAGILARPQSSAYQRLIKKLEFSHYAFMAMAVLTGTCLGSISTMMIFQNDAPMWQFVLGLSFTLANLVASIAQAPTKWVLNMFASTM